MKQHDERNLTQEDLEEAFKALAKQEYSTHSLLDAENLVGEIMINKYGENFIKKWKATAKLPIKPPPLSMWQWLWLFLTGK
jgi:hypothetical protein